MAPQLTRMLAVASCATGLASSLSSSHFPDMTAAQDHSLAFFNSIYSAMRQFGSSNFHNGMSFYLAQAPEGSIFYHGDYRPDVPPDFEWMAFEFEHAYCFAISWEPPTNTSHASFTADPLLWHAMARRISRASPAVGHMQQKAAAQVPISSTSDDSDEKPRPGPYWPDLTKPARGYFHTYMANRPLNLLYIDGEAAAKCNLGSLDSQDYLLLDWDPDERRKGGPAELKRAATLCDLAQDWRFEAGGKIDGFIRMEAGFEIIYCDFFDGLEQLSVQATPFRNETGAEFDPGEDFRLDQSVRIRDFEWLRAAAGRFHGHPTGRLEIDWSSMVSAFAYPINLANPDLDRPDLPRVVQASREDWQNIRDRLRDVVAERGGRAAAEKGVVNWQAVVDRIVTRFSKRLWGLSTKALGSKELILGIGTLIDPFINYLDHTSDAERLAVSRCAEHYVDAQALHPQTWTLEDHAIAAAVQAVSNKICTSLFSARAVLRSNITTPILSSDQIAEKAQSIIQELVADLRWSTWKECEGCRNDEICSIPMFPVGNADDYFRPSCKNATSMLTSYGYFGWPPIV